jgi:hypothetical protein
MTTTPEVVAFLMPLLVGVFGLSIAYLAHRSARAAAEPVKLAARKSPS